MRRIIKLLLLTFLFPINASSQTIVGRVATDEWESFLDRTFALNSKDVAKGRVKSISEREFHAKEKFGEVVKGFRYFDTTPTFFYDVSGKILECKIVFDERTKQARSINGNLVYDDYFTTIFHKYLFSYNNSGMLFEINEYREDDNKLEKRTKFKLNIKGNPIEKNVYYKTGALKSKHEFKYDENNNLISVRRYNHNKNIEEVIYFTYNDKNLRITSTSKLYSENTEFLSSLIYIYNDKNQIVSRVSVSSRGYTDELRKYIYDSNENIITIVYFKSLNPDYDEEFDSKEYVVNEVDPETIYYDANGNVIIHDLYKLGKFKKPELFFSRKDKFEYIYDKYGNWISRVFISNDNPEKIIERKIEYYK